MTQSGTGNGNGNTENPEIEVTFEHLDDETQQVQEYWMREDTTGERKLSVGDEVREELGIEEDDESASD